MAKQDIEVGSAPDAGDGEILFDAFKLSVTNIMWRFHQEFKIDKLRMMCYTNAPRLPERPNNMEDQYLCLSNIRISETPISH